MEDIQPAPLQPQPQPVNKKKRTNGPLLVALGVCVIALGGVAYWQHLEAKQAKTDNTATTAQVVTLQNQVKSLQGTITTLSAKTDDEMITATVTAYAHGQKGNAEAKVTVTIDKKQLPFARVQVVDGATGYACVLKKVDGAWLQLYCAQSVTDYTQSQDELYEVPSSIIAS